jgi:hypothetical protein
MESQLVSSQRLISEFTVAQKEYLQELLGGLAQRCPVPFAGHRLDGRITNDPASGAVSLAAEAPADEELFFNTPISDLCRGAVEA